MSGWGEPAPHGDDATPRSPWERHQEIDELGPGQLIRQAWRLYRSNARRFLSIAIVPELLRDLVGIPALAQLFFLFRGMAEVLSDYFTDVFANPERYQDADPAIRALLQERLRGVLTAHDDLAAISAVGNSVGGAVAVFAVAVLTAAALAFAAGHPISLGSAFRQVLRRGGLVKPILAIGLVWVAIATLPLALQSSVEFQAWAGTTGSPRSILLGTLLSLLALVVGLGAIILGIRWALFIPVVLVEGLGVGAGLVRAAQLTRGIRIRLFLATAGVFLLNGLSVGIAATLAGLATWIATGESTIGIAVFLAIDLVGNLLWAPMGPALLAVAYGHRTSDAGTPGLSDALRS